MKKTPTCKYCGEHTHYSYACWKRPKQPTKTPKPTAPKPLNAMRKSAIHTLDQLMSEYVRKKASDKSGMVYCYTCGKRDFYKNMDCGHYRSRRYLQTRFDLDNLRPQCVECNRYKHGNLEIYRARLVTELGEARVAELENRPARKMPTYEIFDAIVAMQGLLAMKDKP